MLYISEEDDKEKTEEDNLIKKVIAQCGYTEWSIGNVKMQKEQPKNMNFQRTSGWTKKRAEE